MHRTDSVDRRDLTVWRSARSDQASAALIALWLAGLPIVVWAAWTSLWSPHPISGSDFAVFWTAGHLGSVAYEADAIRSEMAKLLFDPIVQRPFPYPPFVLFVCSALARLPLVPAFVLWNLLSCVIFAWAARPFVPRGLPPILLTPAAGLCMVFGQVGLVYGALWFLAFRGRGIALGLLTFKPQLGLLAGFKKPLNQLILAALTFAIMAVISELIFPGAWTKFFSALDSQRSYLGGKMVLHYLQSTTPMLGYGIAGWFLYAAGALYFVSRNFNVWTAATAAFLVSPYGFHYDMTVACLGFGVLLRLHWDELLRWQRVVALLGFLSPELVIFGTWWIPPILLFGLFLQTKFLDVSDTSGETLRVPSPIRRLLLAFFRARRGPSKATDG